MKDMEKKLKDMEDRMKRSSLILFRVPNERIQRMEKKNSWRDTG